MNQRTERRQPERRSLPTPGDRRSKSEPTPALDFTEPLGWSDADEAAEDSGRFPESGME